MDANRKPEIPRTTMERLPGYLNFLKSWECPDGRVSSAVIAREMGLSAITVRKDLAYIASGRPRAGHLREELIERIARALGSGACRAAVVVGVGNLGHALMCYKGFAPYGMRVAAGFDVDARIVGGEVDGKPVYPMEALPAFVRRTGTRIGILAVPASGAQEACERMADAGIRGILNFAPAHLRAPQGVRVRHEDFAVSLALLAAGVEDSEREPGSALSGDAAPQS